MNNHLKVFIIIFFATFVSYSQQPEFYFHLKDNPGANYTIFAQKVGISPVFDGDYLPTHDYDTQYEKSNTTTGEIISFYAGPDGYTTNRGFDWTTDQSAGEDGRGVLGLGKYRIEIQRETSPGSEIFHNVFSFYFDVRLTDWDWSPDIIFYFDYYFDGEAITKTLTVQKSINPSRNVPMDGLVELWTELGTDQDWSLIVYNSTLSNDFGGSVNYNTPITFEEAPSGFPFDAYYPGHIFPVQSSAQFWKNTIYTLSVTDQVVNFNNLDYKARHWNLNPLAGEYGNTADVTIVGNDTKSYFKPVLPLTVTNNLEGGSSVNYNVNWLITGEETTIGPNDPPYYAFDFRYTPDKYDITAYHTLDALNTNWTFLNWSDGSEYNIKPQIEVTPTNKDFTANYKGHFRSNSADAFGKNTQSKLLRDDNGIYHLFYISMEKLWYTHSLTTNFTGGWSQEEIFCLDLDIVKSFSADILGNKIVFVYEANSPQSEDCGIFFFYYNTQTQRFIDDAIITSIDPAFLGNALPVISYTPNEQFILYKKDSNSPLKYVRRYLTLNGWSNWEPETDLPYSNSFSSSPSIAGIKNLGTNGQTDAIHIVFQGSERSIKYLYSKLQGNNREFSHYADISAGSGYYYNQSPSISLLCDFLPLVSWTASPQAFSQKAKNEMGVSSLSRMKARTSSESFVWGSFFETGDDVDYTFTKSAASSTSEGVISWSENDGTSSKYARRSGTAYLPKNYCFGQSGIQIGISNGTSLSEMKAVLLNTSELPYVVNASSTNFSTPIACAAGVGGTSKIASGTDITFGRSGVVLKNGVEFIYNIGDILAGDSVISFIDHPDTLLYSSAEELNDVVRSSDFYLSPNTTLFFSNFYYVNNKENADSLLTETDMVNFRAELVKSVNDEVVGTFDNITYNINNLDDYDNINYQVDLANIDQGDYYLRLVSEVEGSAEYNLSDLQNNISNLERKNYKEVYFTGDELPSAYYLSQNYPNPYNPATTINYQLPQNGFVTLKIYDILGKEVATLVNEQKTQGRYSINFDASRLASGVYIYQLRVNDYVSSKKMLLLK